MLLSTLLERVVSNDKAVTGKQHVVHNEIVSGISADKNYGYELQMSKTKEGQTVVNVVYMEAGTPTEKKSFSWEDFVSWLKTIFPAKYEKILVSLKSNSFVFQAIDSEIDLTKSGEVQVSPGNK